MTSDKIYAINRKKNPIMDRDLLKIFIKKKYTEKKY